MAGRKSRPPKPRQEIPVGSQAVSKNNLPKAVSHLSRPTSLQARPNDFSSKICSDGHQAIFGGPRFERARHQ